LDSRIVRPDGGGVEKMVAQEPPLLIGGFLKVEGKELMKRRGMHLSLQRPWMEKHMKD
jgi:hypothetical protein